VLSPEDLKLIATKRRIANRLGFAVQLCLLRYPGQGLGFGEHPPAAMIAFVARQLGASPADFVEYALRDQTRRERRRRRRDQRQIRHRVGIRVLYARLWALRPVLHAGNGGDDE